MTGERRRHLAPSDSDSFNSSRARASPLRGEVGEREAAAAGRLTLKKKGKAGYAFPFFVQRVKGADDRASELETQARADFDVPRIVDLPRPAIR
jgi:hypothetical protein